MQPTPSYPSYALEPFEGAKLKLARAAVHLASLKRTLDDYYASLQITFSEYEEDSFVRYVRFDPKPPKELATIFGDLIHNLRSSLDTCVFDLARVKGRGTSDVKFPFAENESESEKVIRRAYNKYGEDIVQFFLALKPYHSGNRFLRMLHDLDLEDKHRLVMPIVATASSTCEPDIYNIIAYISACRQGGIDVEFQRFERRGMMTSAVYLNRNTNQLEIHAAVGSKPDRFNLRDGMRVFVPNGSDPWIYYSKPKQPLLFMPDDHKHVPNKNVLFISENVSRTANEIVEAFASKFG